MNRNRSEWSANVALRDAVQQTQQAPRILTRAEREARAVRDQWTGLAAIAVSFFAVFLFCVL